MTSNRFAGILPHMSNVLRERVKLLLTESGRKAREVSRTATGKPDTVRNILRGRSKMPAADTLQQLANELGVTADWLLGRSDDRMPKRHSARTSIPELPRAAPPVDVPVMGTAAGSHNSGAFQLNTGVVDWIRRPPALIGARDIYALYVEGTSMEPQFRPGDLVYIHPHKPPRIGDAVIIQQKLSAGDDITATIGILRRVNSEKILIEKHNPKAEIALDRASIISIHKVLTVNELFGV